MTTTTTTQSAAIDAATGAPAADKTDTTDRQKALADIECTDILAGHAFALRKFNYLEYIIALREKYDIQEFLVPIVDKSCRRPLAFNYLVPRKYYAANSDFLKEKKFLLQQFLDTLKIFSSRIDRHIKRLTTYISKLNGEELKVFAEDFSSGVPGHKKSRLGYLIDEYSTLFNCVQFDLVSVGGTIRLLDIVIDKPSITTFAERLRFVRKERNLTQAQVAAALGLSREGYTPYELAKRDPPMTLLIKMAKFLSVSIEWLCGTQPTSN